ncbi:MAG: cytochrome c biogenesis protein CcsA [Bacteroidales bacterium]|jgi:cytochrome c-type biogenesis protein CcsB
MKVVRFLFSPIMMGVLLVCFALAMAVATFLENDFGSASAYNLVYGSWWFGLIMLLLAANLIGQIIELKLYRRAKLTVFLFHGAFIIILTGAAITRYFGYEGSIHIRERAEENRCFSSDKFIGYSVKDEKGDVLAEKMTGFTMSSVSSGKYLRRFSAGGENYEIELSEVIKNATEGIIDSPSGVPIVSLIVMTGHMEMEDLIIKGGEKVTASGFSIGFNSKEPADISVSSDSAGFHISSASDFAQMGMMHGDSIPVEAREKVVMKAMQIYAFKGMKLIPQEMSLSGFVKPVPVDPKQQETDQNAMIFHVFAGDKPVAITLWDKKNEYQTTGTAHVNGKIVEMFYGSRIMSLPFTLKLNKFIFERYPGSNSPSGYKSDVVLIDKVSGTQKSFMIFMNNILKYKGYRFYQSSFDQDEHGTILSINHDTIGMSVTYTGYAIMFLFIILSIFNRRSIFRNINPGYWRSPFRRSVTVISILLILSGLSAVNAQKLVPDRKAAEEFGRVLVQDQKGRTKPLYTLSNDILRKVTHKNEFEGLSSMQVFLGVYFDFENWQNVRMIRIANSEIQKLIGISSSYASFGDIVDMHGGGGYKLSEYVQKAYAKSPGERNKFDKEVMKIDERVNIVYMINTGEFMKLFPLKNKINSWGPPDEALKNAISSEDSLYLKNVMPMFAEALKNNALSDAERIARSVSDYQARFAGYALPSNAKTNVEIFYYKAKIFERLFPFYATLGIVMLIGLIVMVIKGAKSNSLFVKTLSWLLFAGFLFHTLGLGMRWYIAGHAPMSNGYESMIFISWVTLLAGFIFSRQSPFALSATAVLGSMTLMVAHLSFMDPEITNLVPVLKSYLLTIHVSVITGSYGFLGLGAILGLINLILLIFSNRKNIDRISTTIDELTIINYRTLTLGLYFLTIGTFLGAIWANESWGRYWGWDPKETWSLITIIIYSIVIHSKMIPGLKDIFTFNLLSLFALSSVLMTYFGVNYYLSGLHSYASGDPVPVPSFVYVTVILLVAASFLAYLKYDRWRKVEQR